MVRVLTRGVLTTALTTAVLTASMSTAGAQQSARKTCRAAGAAANEFHDARANADQVAADRAIKAFARVERIAPDDLPRDLASQLRLTARALEDLPERASVRQVRLANAQLAHGLTGVMLACDRAGVRVTVEY